MTISCLEILKSSYEQIRTSHETITDGDIIAARDTLRQFYLDPSNRRRVSYSDMAARLAYLVAYAPVNCFILLTILRTDSVARAVESARPVETGRMCLSCLGSGPGTDFLAVARWLNENERFGEFVVSAYDREPTWQDCSSVIAESVSGALARDQEYTAPAKRLSVSISHNIQDVTFDFVPNEANIYTLSFVHSEFSSYRQGYFRDRLRNWVDSAPAGAVFLVADFGAMDCNPALEHQEFMEICGLSDVVRVDAGGQMDWGACMIDGCNPRKSWEAFGVVGRKPRA